MLSDDNYLKYAFIVCVNFFKNLIKNLTIKCISNHSENFIVINIIFI